MKFFTRGAQICFFLYVVSFVLNAQPAPPAPEETMEDGYLALEGGLGYNTYPTNNYFRLPITFTGGSRQREISTRFVLLSDALHASEYFSGRNEFLKPNSIYLYNFGLLDIDYLSWYGRFWSLGLGIGAAHQGFLIAGVDKTAHAATLRLRAHGFIYWSSYFATHANITLPVALYQSGTDRFNMLHGEINMLFDFKGRVRMPEPQSFMFSVSLQWDNVRIRYAMHEYAQVELTPLFKVIIVY
ncbi:MAG TPA: hypothetical protein PLY93_08285 [Turneriella sp.]|nr:hypothetical protein [Turneriella sp.]